MTNLSIPAPTLYECNMTSDFGQGIGNIGSFRVASCRWCHALVVYHSWRAHKFWHYMDAVLKLGDLPTSRATDDNTQLGET